MTTEAGADVDVDVDVSVVVVTYNHAPFIERALESVVAQQTTRSIEIIVSEDCSTDGTTELVRAFAARERRARLLLSARNVRSNEVVARAIRAARGRYICLLDGDDHWTSSAKLERQAAVLDAEPALSACFHNALIEREGSSPTSSTSSDDRWTPAHQPQRVSADEIWHGNPFATCAGMMRANALRGLGPWYADLFPITDWPLYILCAEHGPLAFQDEVVGVYRLHGGGLFSSLPSRSKLDATARFYRRMDAALGGRARDRKRAGATRYFFEWAVAYADEGDRSMARHCLALSLRAGGVGRAVSRREWARCARRVRPW